MPIDDEQPVTPARRINARRSSRGGGGGFSSGISTTSESLRSGDGLVDDDDLDDDPVGMQNRILQQDHSGAAEDGAPNPRQRMNEVAMAGSQTYSKEYRLTLLHRMLMRKVPLDQIARELKVSVSTIEKDRVLLKQHLREESRALNIDEIVGGQQALYGEISGMALRIASDTGNAATGSNGQPAAMRLAAMRTALAANADLTRFYNTAGIFDVLRYRRSEDGSDVSDVQRLMEKTNEMMERMMIADDPAPVRKRITRTGGFKEFTMDDKDASSGDNETLDL